MEWLLHWQREAEASALPVAEEAGASAPQPRLLQAAVKQACKRQVRQGVFDKGRRIRLHFVFPCGGRENKIKEFASVCTGSCTCRRHVRTSFESFPRCQKGKPPIRVAFLFWQREKDSNYGRKENHNKLKIIQAIYSYYLLIDRTFKQIKS